MTHLWIGLLLIALVSVAGSAYTYRDPVVHASWAMAQIKICEDSYQKQHGRFGALTALDGYCGGVPNTDSGAIAAHGYVIELRLSPDRQEYRLYAAPLGRKFFSEDEL